MSILTGWFFLYRGNGYGPYPDWFSALKKFREKHHCEPDRIVQPFYGTAHVENQKLIKFVRKQKIMPEKLDFKNAASTASLIYEADQKILLVQRKHEPFAGKWALPGGFLNCDQETLEQAAAREFWEETNLVVMHKDLELFCVNSDPGRDPRGHVVDHVFLVKSCIGKPEAKDDAARLKFFHLAELPELAFDHEKVLKNFCIRFKNLEREYSDFDIDT